MARINYDNPVKNLPDAFAKGKDSNNYKLLQIEKNIFDLLDRGIRDIESLASIDNAHGVLLDHIWGGRVNLKRGSAESDEQYRVMLKGKIMQNVSDGSPEQLLTALAYMLRCETSEIHIVPAQTKNGVIVKSIPLETIYSAEFSTEQVLELINKLLPANIEIVEYNFSGTFELGASETDFDEQAGLGETVNSEIGGFLGLSKKGD